MFLFFWFYILVFVLFLGWWGFQFVVISIRVVSSVPKCRGINIEASRSTWSGQNDEENGIKKRKQS